MPNSNNNPSQILLPLLAESLQVKAISSLPVNAEIEIIEANAVPDLIEILCSVKKEETFAIIDAIPMPEVKAFRKADKKWRGKMRILDSIHSENEFKEKLKNILDTRKIHHSNEDKTICDEETTQDWSEATTVPFFA